MCIVDKVVVRDVQDGCLVARLARDAVDSPQFSFKTVQDYKLRVLNTAIPCVQGTTHAELQY